MKVYNYLLKTKLINKKNIIKISDELRDFKIPAFKDIKSNIIFLKKIFIMRNIIKMSKISVESIVWMMTKEDI